VLSPSGDVLDIDHIASQVNRRKTIAHLEVGATSVSSIPQAKLSFAILAPALQCTIGKNSAVVVSCSTTTWCEKFSTQPTLGVDVWQGITHLTFDSTTRSCIAVA